MSPQMRCLHALWVSAGPRTGAGGPWLAERQSPEALAGLGDPAGCSCSEEPEREMSQHHMRKGWLEINSDEAGDDIALEGLW